MIDQEDPQPVSSDLPRLTASDIKDISKIPKAYCYRKRIAYPYQYVRIIKELFVVMAFILVRGRKIKTPIGNIALSVINDSKDYEQMLPIRLGVLPGKQILLGVENNDLSKYYTYIPRKRFLHLISRAVITSGIKINENENSTIILNRSTNSRKK